MCPRIEAADGGVVTEVARGFLSFAERRGSDAAGIDFPSEATQIFHGAIKQFYGVEPEEEIPATLDYMIAAIGG